MVAWRWRRCPNCQQVERASDFQPIREQVGWGPGRFLRECPHCAWVGETREFRVVRELRTERFSRASRASVVQDDNPIGQDKESHRWGPLWWMRD